MGVAMVGVLKKYRWHIVTAVIVLLLSSMVATWVHVSKPNPAVTATNEAVEALTIELKEFKEQVKVKEEQTRKEVQNLHVAIKKDVAAMDPDDVALGLNAELSEFRRIQTRPEGMDDTGEWVLGF